MVCFDESGVTPLHLASQSGNVDMIEVLVEKGAPVNIMADCNYAPIHLAARAGQSLMCQHGQTICLPIKITGT